MSQPGWFRRRGADDILHCEDVSLLALASQVGTPVYLYSASAIDENYQRLRSIFQDIDVEIHYAVKANSNLSILRQLARLGSGFDVVSAGELERSARAGADPGKIVFSGVGKTREELLLAVRQQIASIHLESVEEARALVRLVSSLGATARVALRLNPDIRVSTHPYIATGMREHKFGIETDQIRDVLEALSHSQVELVGLACHLGSQITDVQPYIEAYRFLSGMADDMRAAGHPIQYVDIGGGFGIRYQEEKSPDLSELAMFVGSRKDGYRLVMEPGRFIVGNAGVLLTRVLYRKNHGDRRFVICDAAMNDLMRPALYNAFHEVRPVARAEGFIQADLVGPVCESGDFFARQRDLPIVGRGDHLAIMNAGAYGFVLASNYNARPRPPEVMVRGEHFQIVRKREELEDLMRGESLDD